MLNADAAHATGAYLRFQLKRGPAGSGEHGAVQLVGQVSASHWEAIN